MCVCALFTQRPPAVQAKKDGDDEGVMPPYDGETQNLIDGKYDSDDESLKTRVVAYLNISYVLIVMCVVDFCYTQSTYEKFKSSSRVSLFWYKDALAHRYRLLFWVSVSVTD